MTIKSRLYSIQNRFHQSIQESSRIYLGNLSQELKTYYCEYDKEFTKGWRKSCKNKLLDSCLGSSLILCGDYHSSAQAPRTVLRISRAVIPQIRNQKRKPYLCLEWLSPEHNLWVQRYQQGLITKEVFLKKVGFQKWGFQWENYEPLFAFARKFRIPILGVSPRSSCSLENRDLFTASILANWLEREPQGLFICLMGDLHLAQKHLPQKIKDELQKKKTRRTMVIIHQNHENLYLKFRRKNARFRAEILISKPNTFCVLNSSPWMKLSRHLQWLDNQELQGEERIDCFLRIQQSITGFLGIPSSFLEDGSAIDPRDLSDNLNHLAAFTAKRIHARLRGQEVLNNPFQVKRHFYSLVWSEALGWLGSRIINPDRKVPGLYDLTKKPLLNYFQTEKEMKGKSKKARALIWYRFVQNQRSSALVQFTEAAGRLLGHALYGLIERNKMSASSLRSLFQNPCESQAEDLYFFWLKKIDRLKLRDFASKEKL